MGPCNDLVIRGVDFDALANALGLETEIGKRALPLALHNVVLLDQKQQDYGPHNILRHGEVGVIVRIDDKTSRLAHLLDRPVAPSNESLVDSWRDIANYGLIGWMLRTGVWK